ncbi:MAG: stage III sporulation protein AF [Cellulosilyticum sp.]|nr:stage III sporulation protein AF [Cellulosilyticum sp.]
MSEYLQYLIWMMLFVIVIEMVFPDMAYRKYIKLVLGCILVYTMLKPILGLIQVDGANYKDYVERYQKILGTTETVENTYIDQLENQKSSLEMLYQTSMKQYIEQQVDVSVLSLNITFKDENIEQVDMVVGKKGAPIKIGEIHIGDKSDTVDGAEEELKNKIKTCLNDFYNVQVRNIYITVQKN